ncbi:hypothetical protein GCM10011400_61520 [Paraburkholderia caffeinilytica]|uniref:Arc-like DNA binding domain-containing protein n=1 Tax=Paraburkholderia caffeinilytica TaxID=1761016 RepID=A0ABQ1NAI1_9BURK|nr:hypothetical protein GCM10011400_61520 [Paraburkholderia caffeinilytica]CAB3802405.1 hypothetical protein LMG28690_05563 [Paraburkholderia caffeinilytica]
MGDIVRSQCRLPRELNEWLIDRAKQEARSKNAQLIVELRTRRAELGDGVVCKECASDAPSASPTSRQEQVSERD